MQQIRKDSLSSACFAHGVDPRREIWTGEPSKRQEGPGMPGPSFLSQHLLRKQCAARSRPKQSAVAAQSVPVGDRVHFLLPNIMGGGRVTTTLRLLKR